MKKVAFITGGTRGIGYSIARHLAADGFDIAVNGVRPAGAVTDTIEELRATGADVFYCQGDTGSAADRTKMLQQVGEYFGRLHVLVNNAGVAPKERRDILTMSEDSFDQVLSVNLKGAFFLAQQAANWMIGQKNDDGNFAGCIINISSISATVASINRGEYCISKAGLSMVTQLLAVRLGEYDIPVYELRPGIINTDMTAGVKEKYDKLIEGGLCLQKRWGYPDDVGKAVSALALRNFPYSTGQVIMIDGGLTLPRL
ncbi:MAG: 3-ketoacyl-ACP reductase [Puia sp.]|nr:3-ketoacyl-ACP reductase [Puia sp.]